MAVQQTMTFEGYLTWLQRQEMRYQYDRGQVVAMAGSSPAHDDIERALFQELAVTFEGTRYEAYTSGKLVTNPEGDVGYFGDATLMDGRPVNRRYGKLAAATNPAAVFEILSPGTRKYDEGRKLEVYQSIPTMREVFLLEPGVAQAVRHFRKEDGEWDQETVEGLGASLPVLGVAIPMARIYRNVELAPLGMGK